MHLNTPKRRRTFRTAAIALSSAALVGLAVGIGPRDGISATESAAPTSVQAWPGYADLVEQVMPSVVGIMAKRDIGRHLAGMPEEGSPGEHFGMPFDEDDPGAEMFRRFMERFFGQEGMPEMPRRGPHGFRAPVAAGSGFVVSKDGLIVTNNHVIDGASEVTVILHDGEEIDASVVGRDPDTDLALLQIETDRELQPVSFADASEVRVGDPIVAIGSPFGLGGTVTAGIVSADHRAIGAGRYDDFLQIDAAINRGNSGGPTFNLDGEVIGVNTLIHSPSGGNVGIGFAIPADLTQRIIDDLRDDGKIERGWLGVHIQAIDEDLAATFGLAEAEGALISRVTPDSPAAAAGLEQGDIIVGYAGEEIEDLRDLTRAVADTTPSEVAEVVVWRDGTETTLEVEIGQMPMDDQQVAALEAEDDATPKLGIALARITPETREQLGLDEDARGVVVTDVVPGSPAAEKGVQQGDVIVEANQTTVDSPEQVMDAVRAASEEGRETILLLVQRNGQDRFVAVPLRQA